MSTARHQHQHHHGHGSSNMMVTNGLTRGQFAKIIFPLALFLIIFVAYSILVYIYSLSLNTTQLPIDAILFCILWTLLLTSFLRGAFSSPGLVESGWYKRYPKMHASLKEKFKIYKQQMEKQQQWMNRFNDKNTKKKSDNNNNDNDDDENTKLLIKEEEDNQEEEEKEEELFPDNFARPPRSHYCHELSSNVLRMDHFCVWFNNAVGFYNYKYFLLTIIYLLISCLLTIFIIIYRVFLFRDSNLIKFNIINTICLLLTFIISIFFTIFAGMHSLMHLWQMSKNLTSIEYHKFIQIKSMANHFQIIFPNTHEFDHGIFENCKKMLGYDIWFWCLPLSPSFNLKYDDGYTFQINQENKIKIENVTKEIQSAREKLWKRNQLIK